MKLWRISYTMRRYNQQKFRNGYATRGYTDTTVMLNVQTISSQSSLSAEGHRATKRIKSFGDFPFRVEDVRNGIQADRLFFNGEWYKCESSVYYEHTPLSHYKSEFVSISEVLPETETAPPSVPSNQAENGGDELNDR